MDLASLKPKKGARKRRKRIGRGPGSGHGKTATRGHKGQQSRSGYRRRFGFEGGQMPLIRRVPKRGFINPFRKIYQIVNLEDLNRFRKGTAVTPEKLIEVGLIKKNKGDVKILARGELKKALKVSAHAFSSKAKEKIEAIGGSVEVLGQ